MIQTATQYWVETVHGVTVDVVNNIKGARAAAAQAPFRKTANRIYYCTARGQRVYVS